MEKTAGRAGTDGDPAAKPRGTVAIFLGATGETDKPRSRAAGNGTDGGGRAGVCLCFFIMD